MEQQLCPEWHYHSDELGGVCTPITKSFKEWVQTTGIGEMIPFPSHITMDYYHFKEAVNSVLSDTKILKDIQEEYCKVLEESQTDWMETPMDKLKRYQHEFNLKMARLNT